ncbi:hypothetical protein ACFQX7_10835 [Luedemannella flava]
MQFHPESIGSSHGRRLLDNFRALTGTGRRRRPAPTKVDVKKAEPARRLRVRTRTLPTRWEAEAAFAALFAPGPDAFWLDSSRPDGVLGRFSIMGNADGPLARVATADVTAGVVTIRSHGGTTTVDGPFLSWLDEDLAACRIDDPGLPCPFALGWVGYLGYELKAECGGEPAHRSDLPDAAMIFADRALVLDHVAGTTYLLALADDDDRDAEAWLDTTAQRLATVDDAPGARPRAGHGRAARAARPRRVPGAHRRLPAGDRGGGELRGVPHQHDRGGR